MRNSNWRSGTTIGKPRCSKSGSSHRRPSTPFTRNLETSRQSLAGARAEEGRARLASTMPRAHLGINSAVGNDLGIALRDGCKNQHTGTVLGKVDAVRQELIHRLGMQLEHVEANGLH